MWILKVVYEDRRRTYALDDRLEVIQMMVHHIADSGLVKMTLRWEP